jgi:hypothetical protein
MAHDQEYGEKTLEDRMSEENTRLYEGVSERHILPKCSNMSRIAIGRAVY